MMGFGYFVMKKLVFDLVDEVWDDGEALLIKNRGQEEHVALRDIKNVSYSHSDKSAARHLVGTVNRRPSAIRSHLSRRCVSCRFQQVRSLTT